MDWDQKTTVPSTAKLERLGMGFLTKDFVPTA